MLLKHLNKQAKLGSCLELLSGDQVGAGLAEALLGREGGFLLHIPCISACHAITWKTPMSYEGGAWWALLLLRCIFEVPERVISLVTATSS